MPGRDVIFNADDLGASEGINRGIIEAHTTGVVTSASLMTRGGAAAEAAELMRGHPGLAVGLHWDVTGVNGANLDLTDALAVRREIDRQLHEFESLTGRLPTHLDSHKHLHRRESVMPLFQEAGAELGVPVRGAGAIVYDGRFHAHRDPDPSELEFVSVEFLQWLLTDEMAPGWTEIGCHPGYRTPGFASTYDIEREVEVRTLTDPRIRETIQAQGISIVSHADHPASRGRDGGAWLA